MGCIYVYKSRRPFFSIFTQRTYKKRRKVRKLERVLFWRKGRGKDGVRCKIKGKGIWRRDERKKSQGPCPTTMPYKGKFPTGKGLSAKTILSEWDGGHDLWPVDRKPCETFFYKFQEAGICMYAIYCAWRRALPIRVQEKCTFFSRGIQDITPAARITASWLLKLSLSPPSFSCQMRSARRKEMKNWRKKGSTWKKEISHVWAQSALLCFFFLSLFFLSFPSSDQIRSERARILSFIAGDNMNAREGARGETGGG